MNAQNAFKVAIYSRVSTERDQNPEAQRKELTRYCGARGWKIIEDVVDHGYSGATDQRPGFKRLLYLVRMRQVDAVVVMKMDRLARSLKHLVCLLDEFRSLNVLFVSLGDQIDLGSAGGRLMAHLLGAFAEFERALIRERTALGLAHARSKGKQLGRPRLHDPSEIRRLREAGLSYRKISSQLGVPMGTITTAIRTAHKTPSDLATKSPMKTGKLT